MNPGFSRQRDNGGLAWGLTMPSTYPVGLALDLDREPDPMPPRVPFLGPDPHDSPYIYDTTTGVTFGSRLLATFSGVPRLMNHKTIASPLIATNQLDSQHLRLNRVLGGGICVSRGRWRPACAQTRKEKNVFREIRFGYHEERD